jgi:CheY-like chemotaxis protein
MSNSLASQTILIVEDSDDDYETTEIALRESNLKNPLVRCENGEQALDYLYKRGNHIEAKRPGIILLDLNMPGIGGRDVLRQIKSDKTIKDIPVVVLTTSSDERDIDECYAMGANTYIQKPVDLENFMAAIKRMKEYWFEIAILPKR